MNKVSANSPTSGNERLVLLALADACSCTRVCERVRPGSLGEPVAAETGAFFIALFRRSCWPRLSAASSCRAVAAAFAGGWTPDRLAEFAGFSTAGIKNPYAVLTARLAPAGQPPSPSPANGPSLSASERDENSISRDQKALYQRSCDPRLATSPTSALVRVQVKRCHVHLQAAPSSRERMTSGRRLSQKGKAASPGPVP